MNARHNSCCYIFPSICGPNPIVRWAYYHGLILTITAANHSNFLFLYFHVYCPRRCALGLSFHSFLMMSQNERVQKSEKQDGLFCFCFQSFTVMTGLSSCKNCGDWSHKLFINLHIWWMYVVIHTEYIKTNNFNVANITLERIHGCNLK